jgi:micrococcal nuclease
MAKMLVNSRVAYFALALSMVLGSNAWINRVNDELVLSVPELTAYDVVSVVDGDTIKVDIDGETITVRLIGVDTPETKHPNKPVEYYGNEAAAFTGELLSDEQVYLEPDQGSDCHSDRYNRLLAHVWRVSDELLIAHEIIYQGYGFYYSKYPFREEYMEAYAAAEKDARINERGLWAENE